MIDFDLVLERVGSFGTYQIVVFLSLCYAALPSGMNALAAVFIAYTPEYRCYVYPFDNSTLYPNLTEEAILNLTTPVDKEGEAIDSCVRYDYNLTECTDENDFSCVNKTAGTVSCDQGMHYDDSIFTETAVTEFNMVCDQRVLNSVQGAMYMTGMLVGSTLYGIIADRFGRKIGIVTSSVGMLLVMLGTAFIRSVELFIAARFFVGIFSMGSNVSIFCYIMEIVGPNRRTFVGIAYAASFVVGYMLWSGIGYGWRDWHQMQLASFVLFAPILIIVLFVPESPRWLLISGKDKKGKKVVATMAKFNKTKIDEDFWNKMEKVTEVEEEKEKATTIDLFRYPGLRLVTLNVGFNWAVNSMVYYGISLNAGSLAGDIFINNALAGVLEITSYVICALILDRVGRRLLLTVTLTGAGVGLLASTIVNEYSEGNDALVTAGVVFAFIAKALVSGSFTVIYILTSELYPTVLRSNGVGFGSMSARIGSILSPFIIGLQDYATWIPNTIFGTVAVIGGLLSLTFRDTTGRPMMETIAEAELFHTGKDIEIKTSMAYAYDNEAVELDEKHSESTQL